MVAVMDSGFVGCSLTSNALASEHIRVLSVDGTESLGRLYEFTVRFAHDAEPLTEDELDKLLLAPCCLTIGDGDPINGIAREVRIHEAVEGRTFVYDVVLVPTVWLMTVSKMSRLYQAKAVKDMATQLLGLYGLTGHTDMRVSAPLPPRDFAIQYHESDWDYLQRWFEHDGLFYWFEHSSSGEKLVVADSNSAATPISGDATLPYLDLGGAGMTRPKESVFLWRAVQRRIPARVVVKDYNEEKPQLPLVGQATVDTKRGFGTFFEYGDDFDTPADGDVVAGIRADRFNTERLTLQARTDSVRFHVGHTFTLAGHFESAQNRKYLITAIRHQLGAFPHEGDGREVFGYRSHFEAIPLSVQFRPERVTPWPCISGLMHGHIDSATDGKYSTLDKKARYKVRFPFDSLGAKGDGSSIWIRMAHPYVGSGYGTHMPLHAGTEVILAFYDGDPDRPIIVGAVPNALTRAPTSTQSATQSVMRNEAGAAMVVDAEVGHRHPRKLG